MRTSVCLWPDRAEIGSEEHRVRQGPMGLAKRFWHWLTSTTYRTKTTGHPDLYPLDVDALAKELNLAEEARRLGVADLPAAHATALSGPEDRIIQRVEKARQDYVVWATRRFALLSEDLGRRNIAQDVNRANRADQEFDRKASAELTETESLLRTLGEKAKTLRGELEAFRLEHGLTREANYPSSSKKFFLAASLVVIVLIEGVLNAKFFAEGLSGGLLDGILYAGALAAINVTVAFLLGRSLVRNIYHARVWRRLGGIAALLSAIVIMVTMGLVIAHYRDSLTNEAVNAAESALQTLLSTPLHLRDVFSWVLFGATVFFGSIALMDGLHFDDRYPGYGAISRRVETAIGDYEDELEALRTKLNELKDDELKRLDETAKAAQVSLAVFESLIENKKTVESRLSAALHDADNSMKALLSIFRTENELHRTTPRPAYFDTAPKLVPLKMPDFDTATDEYTLQEQLELVKTLLDELEEIRARIQTAFNKQFDQVKPLGTHFPAKESA